jgi:hypothetical protein
MFLFEENSYPIRTEVMLELSDKWIISIPLTLEENVSVN